MSEQILVKPINNQIDEKTQKALKALEQARVFHEKYLIRKSCFKIK